ncbi:hypothetical protein [Streptomyces mirabilis]|uniref:hypothetical protein n=1 Tax=Streptomyces mirabilis TaxID=68239 RepID=UPI0036A76CFF
MELTVLLAEVSLRTAYDQWTQFEEFPQFMEGAEKGADALGMIDRWVKGDLHRFKDYVEREGDGWRGRIRPGDPGPLL